jgi:hypothetical protein
MRCGWRGRGWNSEVCHATDGDLGKKEFFFHGAAVHKFVIIRQ